MVLIISIVIVSILIIGFITLVIQIRQKVARLTFADEYRNRFIKVCDEYSENRNKASNRKFDPNDYMWLMMNVNKIQTQLGGDGIMHYIAPFQTHTIPNYEIILNTLPKLRNNKIEEFDINYSDDSLLRHIGKVQESYDLDRKRIKNPLMWLVVGFDKVTLFPFYLFQLFGILEPSTIYRISQTILFKIIRGLIGLITLVGSIMSIIQGREETIDFINSLFQNN